MLDLLDIISKLFDISLLFVGQYIVVTSTSNHSINGLMHLLLGMQLTLMPLIINNVIDSWNKNGN